MSNIYCIFCLGASLDGDEMCHIYMYENRNGLLTG